MRRCWVVLLEVQTRTEVARQSLEPEDVRLGNEVVDSGRTLASRTFDPYTFRQGQVLCTCGRGSRFQRAPESPVDSELHFEWPEGRPPTDLLPREWRPLARRKRERAEPPAPPAEDADLRETLEEALATIARLEGDRRAARVRIDKLEAERGALQTRVTAQRRRLLLLERQMEDVNVAPAEDVTIPASWIDRLFGGLSSVSTA